MFLRAEGYVKDANKLTFFTSIGDLTISSDCQTMSVSGMHAHAGGCMCWSHQLQGCACLRCASSLVGMQGQAIVQLETLGYLPPTTSGPGAGGAVVGRRLLDVSKETLKTTFR